MPGKILIWYWGRRGGGPLMTQLLAQHLVERGLGDRLVLSLSAQNELIETTSGLGLELWAVETFRAKPTFSALVAQTARLRREFRRLMERVRPDVVVIPMLFGAAPFLIDLARRADRLIYVAHDARRHPGDEAGRGQHLAQALLIRLADQVIAPSRYVAGELGRLYPRAAGRIGTEPLTGLYRPALTTPRARPVARPLRFLAPGRLVRYKGYRRLAAALDLMPGDLAYELTVAGDGPDHREVERLFAPHPSVRLDLRWQTPEEQSALFRTHDVLICPYDEASQSGVICEALVHAMPSIVTPVGALPEQIGHGRGGTVLADMTPATLAAAMMASVAGGGFSFPVESAGCVAVLATAAAELTWVQRTEAAGCPNDASRWKGEKRFGAST